MITRSALLIFPLELEISGVAVQRIHQNSKNDEFCGNCLGKMTFEAVLATFRCYVYGANFSEAI